MGNLTSSLEFFCKPRIFFLAALLLNKISIGNSMVSRGIWDKYRE